MFDGPFTLHSSPRRKRVGFRVNDAGTLEVYAPAGMSESALRKIMAANLPVIERARRDFCRRKPPVRRRYCEGELFPFGGRDLPLTFSERLLLAEEDRLLVPRGTPEQVRADLEKLCRKCARTLFEERCRILGAPEGLRPDSVGITGAVTRWGSCSSRKHISFCWKIMLLPEDLADYIVCHELAHLRHMDHSKAFWELTGKLCPDPLLKRKRLQELPELWPLPSNLPEG